MRCWYFSEMAYHPAWEAGLARGTLRVVGQPVSLGRTPSHLAAAPPERGEHTDEVLREFGFSDSEIARLRTAKVI